MAFISDQGKCRSQQNRSLPEIFNVAAWCHSGSAKGSSIKYVGSGGVSPSVTKAWRGGEGVGPTVTSRWAFRMTFKNKGSKPLQLAKNSFKTGENSQSRIIYGNQLFETLFSICLMIKTVEFPVFGRSELCFNYC